MGRNYFASNGVTELTEPVTFVIDRGMFYARLTSGEHVQVVSIRPHDLQASVEGAKRLMRDWSLRQRQCDPISILSAQGK